MCFFDIFPHLNDTPFVTHKELDIRIENIALDEWRRGELIRAEALLTAAIPTSEDTTHHVLASRALVRARLRQWDAALVDADEVNYFSSQIYRR